VWQRWANAHPDDANAVAQLGALEEANGNNQVAEADYRHSLQMRPQQPIAANNLACILLQNGGDVNVALSLAQIARQAMPNSPDTADTLAWAYYFKGTYGLARDLLEGALKLEPNNATIQYHLGMVYSKLQNKWDAAIHLKKAIALGHGSSAAADAQAALQKLG
jgi:cellulose synthase operon protein C